jgi:putative ABC transport system permease protein
VTLTGSLYIGWRYLLRHLGKAILLTSAITLSIFLPIGIMLVVQQAEQHLRSRSVETPLVLGAAGSPLELVFNGVYFSEPGIETITAGEGWSAGGGLATVIPIHARFSARDARIVGTTIDYFDLRGLRPAVGGLFTRIGDCVLGARVAERLGLGVGDSIVSTPEQVFDLAGVYPLKMRIMGVMTPNGSVDDRSVFVDLNTAWVIEGLAHGHTEAADVDDDAVLDRDGDTVQLNASIVEYAEVTDDNIDSFHFHGSQDAFPITAAILVPHDAKSETILLGRYVGDRRVAQLVRPDDVMENLFATVFQVRNVVVVALVAIGVMAAGIAMLVFMLSNRLRAREFESLASIGADRGSVRLLVLFEGTVVVLTSVLLTAALVLVLQQVLPRLLPLLTG